MHKWALVSSPGSFPLSVHKPGYEASAQLVSKKFLEEIRAQAWARG